MKHEVSPLCSKQRVAQNSHTESIFTMNEVGNEMYGNNVEMSECAG